MNWFLKRLSRLFSSTTFPRTRILVSKYLARKVKIDLYFPSGFKPKDISYPCFIFNDGQDLPRMNFEDIMQQMLQKEEVPNFVAIGLHAADRMREYGTAEQADYANRGDQATAYENFICLELLPWLRKKHHLAQHAEHTHIAGFSLGGLSAFDLLWRNPGSFHTVGVFSGALWWRSTKFDPKNPDADRITHTRVANGSHQPGLRFWFQAGTEDEKSDRNKNGVIDAIDDTLHLIEALKKQTYQKNKDIRYLEIKGGKHEPHTWGEAMPDFIRWTLLDSERKTMSE